MSTALSFSDMQVIDEELSQLDCEGTSIDKFKQILAHWKQTHEDVNKSKTIKVYDKYRKIHYYFNIASLFTAMLEDYFGAFNNWNDTHKVTFYTVKGVIENTNINIYSITDEQPAFTDKGYDYVKSNDDDDDDEKYQNEKYLRDDKYWYKPYSSTVEYKILDEMTINEYAYTVLMHYFKFTGKLNSDKKKKDKYYNTIENLSIGNLSYEQYISFNELHDGALTRDDKNSIQGMYNFMNELKRISKNNYHAFFEEYALQRYE